MKYRVPNLEKTHFCFTSPRIGNVENHSSRRNMSKNTNKEVKT
jgi:hypothetical protein